MSKPKSFKLSELNLAKGQPALNLRANEEDPILRDLQAYIQAENEIREIFSKNKNKKYFNPPILFNNFQKKTDDSKKILTDGLNRYSPP